MQLEHFNILDNMWQMSEKMNIQHADILRVAWQIIKRKLPCWQLVHKCCYAYVFSECILNIEFAIIKCVCDYVIMCQAYAYYLPSIFG